MTYRAAGVDIDAGNMLVKAIAPLARATARPGSDADLGGFGGVFDIGAAGFRDPVLVAANDGVGTKVKIAIDCGRHDTVGVDLVAMCVNDLVVQGAEPLFFLDYYACARLDGETAREVVAGIAAGCRQAGAALIGGETAEMPGLYNAGDYDLAGFAVGAAERGTLLPGTDIAPGDRLLGIASSGLHSNGFSLVRRVVEVSGLALDGPAPFDPDCTLGEALLTPTRIYVKAPLAAIRETGAIKALAHITGGGMAGNVPRVLPEGVAAAIDLANVRPAPVFGWLAAAGNIAADEMLSAFNCGIGMIAVVDRAQARAVAAILEDNGERVVELGELVTAPGAAGVRFSGQLDLEAVT